MLFVAKAKAQNGIVGAVNAAKVGTNVNIGNASSAVAKCHCHIVKANVAVVSGNGGPGVACGVELQVVNTTQRTNAFQALIHSLVKVFGVAVRVPEGKAFALRVGIASAKVTLSIVVRC